MAGESTERWHPTRFRRFVRASESSTLIARIVTDAGTAMLKPMSKHVSPHKLACELVGTQLAAWLGLQTFQFDILTIRPEDEIPLKRRGLFALPGPAFVTRFHRGMEWSGEAKLLRRVDNPDDISRLVVFDTWTLNWDRHAPREMGRRSRPDNVFLSHEGATRGRFRLIAMDQTECFAGGPEFARGLANIDRVQDERVYGLFPAFAQQMRRHQQTQREMVRMAAGRLRQFDRATVEECIMRIPREWGVSDRIKELLADLIVGRARFIADRIEVTLARACGWQDELDFGIGGAT